MSSEDYAVFKVFERQRKEEGAHRRFAAAGQFNAASQLASLNGFILRRLTAQHYQLYPRDKSWLMNVYPGNRRIYQDRTRRGPFLSLPDEWTLHDVVNAAIAANRPSAK